MVFHAMSESLLQAIKKGKLRTAEAILLDDFNGDLEYQDELGDGTALYWASAKGHTRLVRLLLVLGASCDSVTGWGGTPIHGAADNGQTEIVKILLENGSKVNALSNTDNTPCHLAAYRGDLPSTRVLVDAGANIHLKNSSGNDVMREALQTGQNVEVTKYLWTVIKGDYKTPTEDMHPIFAPPERCAKCNAERHPSHERYKGNVRRSSVIVVHQTGRRPFQELHGMNTDSSKLPHQRRRRSVFVPAEEGKLQFSVSNHDRTNELGGNRRIGGKRPLQLNIVPNVGGSRFDSSPLSIPSESEVDWDVSQCVDNYTDAADGKITS